MKRVLVAGFLGGLLLLGTPTLASSADRHDSRDDNHHSRSDDRRGDDRGGYDHHDHGRYGYSYGDPYYDGGYQDCYHDPSGYTTCEPYGGDYDPWGYNYRPPRDPNYCDHPHSAHSAHSAKCDEPRAANNGARSQMKGMLTSSRP